MQPVFISKLTFGASISSSFWSMDLLDVSKQGVMKSTNKDIEKKLINKESENVNNKKQQKDVLARW